MIALDSSSLIAYLGGGQGVDVEAVERALAAQQAALPPPVLTEVLSDPALSPELREHLLALPLLELKPGFWARAGALRAVVVGKRRKARLADALIAQVCLDHGAALVTRDKDFRRFAEATDLELLP